MSCPRSAPDYRDVIGVLRGPKTVLRRGITTGTCAQAAARAAAQAILGLPVGDKVVIRLPPGKKPWSGKLISVPLASMDVGENSVTAAVAKDAGDDADITKGLLVRATVRRRADGEIVVRGGRGVGVVKRPGLPIPVGQAAINPTPRAMIRSELVELRVGGAGFDVLIEVDGGEEVALKTWNPRIGVEGGISIIGTSGVVEPASSSAFRRSVYRTAKAFASIPVRSVAVTPGYVGERFLRCSDVPDERVLVVGDHIGFSLDVCARLGFESVTLVGHIGKMAKVAAGLFNTHSRYGDARLETMAAHAGAAGASPELIAQVLRSDLAEQAVPLLREAGFGSTFGRIARAAAEKSSRRAERPVSCVLLSLDGTELGRWPEDALEGLR